MPGQGKIPDGTQQMIPARPGFVPRTAIHSNTDHQRHNFDYATRFKGFKLADKIGNFLRRS